MRHTFFLSLFLMQFPLRNVGLVEEMNNLTVYFLTICVCVYYVECSLASVEF
jgi:hypothetical protein